MARRPQAAPRQAPPATLVIFGGTGDLARRLLMPAIAHLCGDGLIADELRIIGIGAREGSDEDLRASLDEFAPKTECWRTLRDNITYLQGDFTKPPLFNDLKAKLADAGNVVFYLATPAQFFGPIVESLAGAGLMQEKENAFRRVAVEKPFGHDLASARALNKQILAVVDEAQVYRIDHFLGKETVQNIMVARFANPWLEAVWNNRYIDSIQITAAETVDVGTRGAFYDATGALRDMVPNHLFQLMAMVGMEPPNDLSADSIRTEKAKLLEAVRIPTPAEAKQNAVRGQYQGYRKAADVNPKSNVETYVALKFWVDSWRWAGVPFYLRTGKALKARDNYMLQMQRRTAEAMQLINQSKQAKLQEQLAQTMASFQIGDDASTFDEMRDKIDRRAAAAEARMQLGSTSVDNQMQEIEKEAMDMQLQDKLLQYKKEMGLLPAGSDAPAPQALPAQGETSSRS